MPSLPQTVAARQSGIYQIRHRVSGRLYIGGTGDWGPRWRVHRWRLNAGSHHNARLQEDWSRDGAEAFAAEFLEAISDRGEMKEREREYVAWMQPYYNAVEPVRKARAQEPIPPVRAGDRFGYWTVVGEGPNYPVGPGQRGTGNRRWLCHCDCGRDRTVAETSLQRGASTSCGCSKRINTIASIMGRLIVEENGCCTWPGSRHDFGYGLVTFERKHWYVHRLLYEKFVGPIPEGMVLDHVFCNNPPCANWTHVEPKTNSQNLSRNKNSMKTHCKRGHPLSGDNLKVIHSLKRGYYFRTCLTCRVEQDALRYARNKKAAARQKDEEQP